MRLVSIVFRTFWLRLLVVCGMPLPLWTYAANAPSTQPHVDYMVIVTGGELLSGVYPDAHTHFLTRTLRPLGLRCVGSVTVDDRRGDILDALGFARSKVKLVIVTGGLGPTDNDIARETLSEFTGITLREHPDVVQEMERRFGTPRDQLRPNLRRQALVPRRGTYLKNPNGSAVGLVFELGDAVVVSLPGPPRELQPMVHEELVPYLSRRFGTRHPGASLTLRFVGLGQSQISQTLKEHVPLPDDIILSSQFEGSRVDFTFALPTDTPEDEARLQALKREILQHLGDFVYADDGTSLEEHVAKLLSARRLTLAVAEVGSGGKIAAGLGGAENAAEALAGGYIAPTEEKLRRLLGVSDNQWREAGSSHQRIELLAAATARQAGSQWAIVVGDIQRDENGSRYLRVVFRLPEGSFDHRRVGFTGMGELARSGVLTQVLDHMRRKLR